MANISSCIGSIEPISTELLTQSLFRLYGFEPRPQQVDVISTLAVKKSDLILIARTGWGKSLIFQSIPAIFGGICLMIMPLNLLEEDQAATISQLKACNPCVLNASSNSPRLLARIKNGEFSHGKLPNWWAELSASQRTNK